MINQNNNREDSIHTMFISAVEEQHHQSRSTFSFKLLLRFVQTIFLVHYSSLHGFIESFSRFLFDGIVVCSSHRLSEGVQLFTHED